MVHGNQYVLFLVFNCIHKRFFMQHFGQVVFDPLDHTGVVTCVTKDLTTRDLLGQGAHGVHRRTDGVHTAPAGSRAAAVGDEGLCEHLERATIAAASGKIAPAEAEQDDGDDDPDDAAGAEW